MSVFLNIRDTKEIPKDAVLVPSEKVIEFYDVAIDTWKPQSQVWALVHGPSILGVVAGATGVYINVYFRKKLRLKNFGVLTTFLPIMILPTLMVTNFHQFIVQKSIFLDPLGCSLCKQTRAAAVQIGFGALQPAILAPLSTLAFATRHFTYRIPSLIYDRKEFLEFMKKLYKPIKKPMGINIGLQVLIACFITHMEEEHFYRMQNEMTQPWVEYEQNKMDKKEV